MRLSTFGALFVRRQRRCPLQQTLRALRRGIVRSRAEHASRRKMNESDTSYLEEIIVLVAN